MRRTLTAAAALVLLTACSGSDKDDAAPSTREATTGEATTSAAETTAPPANSEFCTRAAGVESRIAATFGGQADRAQLPQLLQEAATEIRTIEPPPELAGDWSGFADGVDQIAAAAQIDFDDQAAVASFQQQVAAAQQQHGAAFAHVTSYLTEECGLVEAPTGTSAPTS
jgi:hypothetical protein